MAGVVDSTYLSTSSCPSLLPQPLTHHIHPTPPLTQGIDLKSGGRAIGHHNRKSVSSSNVYIQLLSKVRVPPLASLLLLLPLLWVPTVPPSPTPTPTSLHTHPHTHAAVRVPGAPYG